MFNTPTPPQNDFSTFLLDLVRDGFHGLGVHKVADRWQRKGLSIEAQVDGIITESVLQGGSAGFLTGLAGPAGLIVNVPASLAIQLRLVGAIALVTGNDLDDPRTQLLALSALALEAPQRAGTKFLIDLATRQGAKVAAEKLLPQVAARAAAQVAGRTAGSAAGKWVPILSGFISAGIDAAFLVLVGKAAKGIFLDLPEGAAAAS